MNRILILVLAILCPIVGFVLAQEPIQNLPMVKIQIYTPDSSVRLAAADLATVDPSERPNIRYLSLYNVPAESRRDVAATVSFVVNSLSKRRKIHIPVFVGGSDETLIRINIDQYEWKSKAWDDLACNGSGPKAQAEPYFHAFIERIVTADPIRRTVTKKVSGTKRVFSGFYQQGQPIFHDVPTEQTIEVIEETPGVSTKKRTFSGAPWVDATALTYLIHNTQSESPILRADWFIVNSTLAPAYYNFLGLGDNIKDFQKLVFADEKLAEQARSKDKAVVISSIVARNNRTLNRSPTFTGGYYWQSHDSLKSVDDRQYIQNLLNEKYDATEDIATLPNGLQAYFLTDGEGKRLDFANPDIAIDNTAHDRLVRTARSCIICHASGILPIADEVRTLTKKLQNQEQIKLLVTDKKDAFKIEDLFSSDLDEQILKDQNLYSSAVARATGLRMDVNAKNYATIYDRYQEVLVSKEVIARDLGVNIDDVEKMIRMSNDPVVLALVRFPPGPVRRDQWERSYQGMMLIMLAQRQGLVPHQPLPPFITPRK